MAVEIAAERGRQASLFEVQKAIGDRRSVIVVDNWGQEEAVEEVVEEEAVEMYYHASRLWRGEARRGEV